LETPAAAAGRNPPRPQRLVCYTFGCPRVGNRAFADLLSKSNVPDLELYRVLRGGGQGLKSARFR
jgi:predicted lipase